MGKQKDASSPLALWVGQCMSPMPSLSDLFLFLGPVGSFFSGFSCLDSTAPKARVLAQTSCFPGRVQREHKEDQTEVPGVVRGQESVQPCMCECYAHLCMPSLPRYHSAAKKLGLAGAMGPACRLCSHTDGAGCFQRLVSASPAPCMARYILD